MKSEQNLSILFWRMMGKKRLCDGMVPIYARITIDDGGGSKEISTGIWIMPENWDLKNKVILGDKNVVEDDNDCLASIRLKLKDVFKELAYDHKKVTAALLKASYQKAVAVANGDDVDDEEEIEQVNHTLLETIDDFIIEFEKMVYHKERSKETLKHWYSSRRKVYAFISHVYKKEDLLLSEIRPSFTLTFLNYMTKEVPQTLAENTAMKQVKKMKQILAYAVNKEWLKQSPIDKFKCKGSDVEVEPLELPEVLKIYEKKNLVRRLEEVRDAFIFQCFTGFAYQDIHKLTPEHIVEVGINRERWLIKKRGKTNVSEMVPLLPVVEDLIEKYKTHPKCIVKNRLMPIDSNGRYNGYLKEIQHICGIVREDIVLDTHLARHTFADMMLNSGVPIEDVSKMLGHKSIRTTQRYCRVKKHRISKNMQAVRFSLFTKSGKLRKTLVA